MIMGERPDLGLAPSDELVCCIELDEGPKNKSSCSNSKARCPLRPCSLAVEQDALRICGPMRDDLCAADNLWPLLSDRVNSTGERGEQVPENDEEIISCEIVRRL